jgi:F0F1-type ATP synthase delta subunit
MTNVSRQQLAQVIAEQMQKTSIKSLAKEVAAYLLSERRTDELPSLMRDIIKFRSQQGIIEASASSAHELSKEVQSALMKLAVAGHKDYKHVILNQDQDSSLVGGARLSTADFQLDLSVQGRLKHLIQPLAERN